MFFIGNAQNLVYFTPYALTNIYVFLKRYNISHYFFYLFFLNVLYFPFKWVI